MFVQGGFAEQLLTLLGIDPALIAEILASPYMTIVFFAFACAVMCYLIRCTFTFFGSMFKSINAM